MKETKQYNQFKKKLGVKGRNLPPGTLLKRAHEVMAEGKKEGVPMKHEKAESKKKETKEKKNVKAGKKEEKKEPKKSKSSKK